MGDLQHVQTCQPTWRAMRYSARVDFDDLLVVLELMSRYVVFLFYSFFFLAPFIKLCVCYSVPCSPINGRLLEIVVQLEKLREVLTFN